MCCDSILVCGNLIFVLFCLLYSDCWGLICTVFVEVHFG